MKQWGMKAMKHLMFTIAVLAVMVSAVVVAGGINIAGAHEARSASPPVQNFNVVDGTVSGEVILSWDAMATDDAKYFRIGWVAVPDYTAVVEAGRPWTEAFVFVDVENIGQSSHRVTRLTPGTQYYFIVGTGNDGFSYYTSSWSSWQSLTLKQGAATAGDYDADNDGLIEISSLAQLDAIRYDRDGDGSVADEHYVAYTQAFSDAVAGMGCPATGCEGYELVADLDFDTNGNGQADAGDEYWNDGKGWEPIGYFTTTFDGNGRSISNLYVNRPDDDDVGLFASLGGGGIIRDVGLASANVTGDDDVGALLGDNNGGIVIGSYAAGSVAGDNTVGGLAGENSQGGLIMDSYSRSSVSGVSDVGGLVGSMFAGNITRSYATGSVTGSGADVGGLVGFNSAGSIARSYATGNVTGGGTDVGGLVGENRAAITGSYATGDVTGAGHTGGLVGRGTRSTIIGSYATGNVTGTGSSNDDIGGLVGQSNWGGLVYASYATGSVTGSGDGDDDIGGLVGWHSSSNVIEDSYATGRVSGGSGSSRVGGLVGHNTRAGRDDDRVSNSYWDTQTSGQSTSSGGEGKTTAELQAPTGNTGIYADWSANWWDYGTASQYPVLRVYGQNPAVQR